MKHIFWSFALCAFSTFAISASTILPGPTDTNPDPNFTFTINAGTDTLTLATPGAGDVDTLTVLGIGNVLISDAGTPGSFILSANEGLTQGVGLTFNIAGATLIDGGTDVLVSAIGTPFPSASTITDPALLQLLGTSTFDFTSAGSTASPFVFDFKSATTGVPEPSVSLALGLCVLGISAFRMRKRTS